MAKYYIIQNNEIKGITSEKEFVKWNNEADKIHKKFSKKFKRKNKQIITRFYGFPKHGKARCFECQYLEDGVLIKILAKSKDWKTIRSLHDEYVKKMKVCELIDYDFLGVVLDY